VSEAGSWPEFHHDARLSGDANVPQADNLAVTTTSLPSATVGHAYSATITAGGGVTPYVWSRTSGSRPPGLTFASNGTWSGTPTAAGSYSFVVQVTDAELTRVSKTLTITVASG
jgi:hypothetical protein